MKQIKMTLCYVDGCINVYDIDTGGMNWLQRLAIWRAYKTVAKYFVNCGSDIERVKLYRNGVLKRVYTNRLVDVTRGDAVIDLAND